MTTTNNSLFVTRFSSDRAVGRGDPATTRVRKERFGPGEGGGVLREEHGAASFAVPILRC